MSEYEFYGTSALERLFSATQVKTFAEDGPALVAFYDSLAEQRKKKSNRKGKE